MCTINGRWVVFRGFDFIKVKIDKHLSSSMLLTIYTTTNSICYKLVSSACHKVPPLWKSFPSKPHYLATKTQKTTHIQLMCNYFLGITINVQLSIEWLLSTTHNTTQWITTVPCSTNYNETHKCSKIPI